MSRKLTIAGDVACDLVMTNEKGEYVHEYDEERHKARVSADAAKHGVTAVMVDPCGPGGGHPVYEFTGTKEQLVALVKDFYEAHDDDLAFYFENAEMEDDVP